ncbi:MAG TPA: hypothetical protein DEH78_19020 [Solibacterales bacterium]|nr:hypothetical protein [Bryobacterales bacterium]
MTWKEIRNIYLVSAGNSTQAIEQSWYHLSNAYRRVCAELDVPEVYGPELQFTTVSGQDWVATPDSGTFDSLYSIYSGFNKTRGFPLELEPEGFRGRNRLRTTTGMPPSGDVTHYVRMQDKIWLRNTPNGAHVLLFQTRFQPADLSDSDLAGEPRLPVQYHQAIIAEAAANYYRTMPEDVEGVASPDLLHSAQFERTARGLMITQAAPSQEDHHNRRYSLRVAGYRVTPYARGGAW